MKEVKRLIRCSNGHFFDGGKYDECPHCNNTRIPDVTVFMGEDAAETAEPAKVEVTAQITKEDNKTTDNHTVHYFQKSIGTEPVVGWLVCVKGVHFGEDFKIRSGRNFIGRSGAMDVSLSGDKAVSRDKHAILTYDPKSNSFMIQPGDSSELCYLNDEMVLIPTKLGKNERISLGESELMFVPFCSDDFRWEDNNQ